MQDDFEVYVDEMFDRYEEYYAAEGENWFEEDLGFLDDEDI